jgi:hypothetical protein
VERVSQHRNLAALSLFTRQLNAVSIGFDTNFQGVEMPIARTTVNEYEVPNLINRLGTATFILLQLNY